MRAELANLNHCAVPFFKAAPAPTCAYVFFRIRLLSFTDKFEFNYIIM